MRPAGVGGRAGHGEGHAIRCQGWRDEEERGGIGGAACVLERREAKAAHADGQEDARGDVAHVGGGWECMCMVAEQVHDGLDDLLVDAARRSQRQVRGARAQQVREAGRGAQADECEEALEKALACGDGCIVRVMGNDGGASWRAAHWRRLSAEAFRDSHVANFAQQRDDAVSDSVEVARDEGVGADGRASDDASVGADLDVARAGEREHIGLYGGTRAGAQDDLLAAVVGDAAGIGARVDGV